MYFRCNWDMKRKKVKYVYRNKPQESEPNKTDLITEVTFEQTTA